MASPIVKRVNVEDVADLRALGDHYAQGIGGASRKILSEVFHKDAIMYGDVSGKLIGGHIEQLYQAVEEYGPSPNMTYQVDIIEALPMSAVLRVHLDNGVTGLGYTDHLSAVKIDSKWRVVCKIYQIYQEYTSE